MRINQFLASATDLSRRGADEAVAAGRVTIDNQPATIGQDVSAKSVVALDGQTVAVTNELSYLMLHKPVGYLCSRRSQGNAPTVYQLLPKQYHHLNLAGRLDLDSSGLVILTNDGPWAHRAAHPSFGKTKRYRLTLTRPLSHEERQQLNQGIQLDDGPSHPRLVKEAGNSIEVTLEEGRKRQLRRSFTALGNPIIGLHRTHFGKLALGDLAPGKFRLFEPQELTV